MKHSNKLVWLSVFLTLFASTTFAFEKRWIKSNSWNDPNNWEPPQLPCPNDNIVIKEDIVYIEKNVTVGTKLDFPSNGEIVFGANSQIEIGKIPITMQGRKRKSISCSQTGGVDKSFVGLKYNDWTNPLNWEFYSNGKRDIYLTKAAPFIERVPCYSDSVSFPEDGAFKVEIANEAYVKDIKINNKVITDNSELQTYLKGREGSTRFNFVSVGELKLDSTISDTCQYSWCKCLENKHIKSICKTFTCPKRSCSSKVKPMSDCCSRCGAIVNINYESNFNLMKCWSEVRKTIESMKQFKGVRVYIYPLADRKEGKVQMLFSEDGDGASSVRVAEYISKYISKFTTCGSKVEAKISALTKKKGSKGGTVALAVILTLMVLAVLGFGFYYFKVKRKSTFKRRRFDNENDFTQFPGAEDVETDFSSHPTTVTPGTTQFANPLYELRDLEDNENKQVEDIPSPEYSIPVRYFNEPGETTDVRSPESIEPRYVENNFSSGLKNPSYSDDLDSKFDPDDVDIGNENPLYAEMMKESADKPGVSEADLDCTDDTESIGMKLELKVGDSSDSETEYGNQFQVPEYAVPNPGSPPPIPDRVVIESPPQIPERSRTDPRGSVENLGFISEENVENKEDQNMSEC